MTFTYNTSDLTTDLAKVRLYIGDTDSTDALMQDEEIQVFLDQYDNLYRAAAFCARTISAKFARKADTKIESVSVSYSQKAKQYSDLAARLDSQANTSNDSTSGPSATGIKVSETENADKETDRLKPSFSRGQFNNPPDRTLGGYEKWR